MLDINVICKMILDAVFEQKKLEEILFKIKDYVQVSYYLVLNSGRIEVHVDSTASEKLESKNIVSLKDYDLFQRTKIKIEEGIFENCKGEFCSIKPVIVRDKKIAFSIIAFEKLEEKEIYKQINDILVQAAAFQLEKQSDIFDCNNSMRRQICMREIFGKVQKEKRYLEKCFSGGYYLLMLSEDGDSRRKRNIFEDVEKLWETYLIKEEMGKVYVVLYNQNLIDKETLIGKLKKINSNSSIYVSDYFEELELCSYKKEILERLEKLDTKNGKERFLFEAEMYTQIVYSYAGQQFTEGEIIDYSIEALLQEDMEKHTNLYQTLKMYLMCENNIADTAEKLYIHRNTLVYRLGKIQTIMNKEINDNHIARELLSLLLIYENKRK